MDNQHQKIKGYRDLTQAEIDLMNRIKAHGEATETLLVDVEVHLKNQADAATNMVGEHHRVDTAQPWRWINIARTHLQLGGMTLVRAVAQPTTF